MPFEKVVSEEVLVKCGRHCCLCRRFNPTMLQVHHIVEESKSGTSDIDNAIALCLTCHSDVHTQRPFTQRFTAEELKQHRDRVYRLVENGELVPLAASQYELIIDNSRLADGASTLNLSDLALRYLVTAAEGEDRIMINKFLGGCRVQAGQLNEEVGYGRKLAEAEAAIRELDYATLVEQVGFEHGGIWELTLKGYQVADTASVLVTSEIKADDS